MTPIIERLSIFDIYKIGVGPSSSHTLGPWKAARKFLLNLENKKIKSIQVELYGSLSKTGVGHGTDIAVMMGLMDFDPEIVDTTKLNGYINEVKENKIISILGQNIDFDPLNCIIFQNHSLPFHPNGLRFSCVVEDEELIEETYFSVGGGFIVKEDEDSSNFSTINLPYPIDNGKELIQYTADENCAISDIVFQNEMTFHTEEFIENRISKIWNTMTDCIYNGCHTGGKLPGGLNVKRRAQEINAKLIGDKTYSNKEEWLKIIQKSTYDFITINKWISCFALAVNEENAAFGRIVTSPTNGASGVIPAVLMYHYCFGDFENFEDIKRFMLVSGEVGCLFKKGATISAAMGGCQAEIGVSSAMAAAGLTELNGGTPEQVLMAAEIAMEHHLGLTCDPIGGLVQVPCIERNTMGAMKAITACHLALSSNPKEALVDLDSVIKTMMETAKDMNSKYKETSEGGLAINITVNIPEC